MKKMSKVLSLALVGAVAMFGLAACGGDETANNNENNGGDVAQKEKLVIATNAEFPPFEFVSSAGVVPGGFDGIDMVVAKELGEKLNMDIEIVNMKFEGVVPSIISGTADMAIAGLTIDPERAEAVDFTVPYWTAVQSIILPEANTDVTSVETLKGKTVAVMTGYTGDLALSGVEGINLKRFKNGTDATQELINGNVDAVVIDSPTAKALINKNKGLKAVSDDAFFETEQYAACVKKGNQELLDKLNKAIQEMLDSGRINEIAAEVDARL